MVKTYTVQNIADINGISFVFNEKGELAELNVTCEVNLGAMGIIEVVNVLPYLTPKEVSQAKSLHKAIERELKNIFLEGR